MPLSARSIFITGASRGIGLEFVKQILKLPSKPEIIVAGCRDPSSASDLQKLAREDPVVKIVKLDVDNNDEIENAKKETEKLVGDQGLSLLINNAGIYDKSNGGSIREETREIMQRHFNTNVSSPIVMTQKFLPLLEKAAAQKGNGLLSASKSAVVNISSALGSQALTLENKSGNMHYFASKSALNMVTVIMANNLENSEILVMAIHPGWLASDMGGPNASLPVKDGVEGCIAVIGDADETRHGRLSSFRGDIMPF